MSKRSGSGNMRGSRLAPASSTRICLPLGTVVPARSMSSAAVRIVDMAPSQIYAQLLDEGVYLCLVSTMYRVLVENKQVKERRRMARHPTAVRPELVATAARQVYSWD